MRTMTWKEVDKDWGGLQKRHRMEIAQAVARYCVGHDMKEVATHLNYSHDWVVNQLDYAGVGAALGGGPIKSDPLTGSTGNVAKEVPRVIKEFAPSVDITLDDDGKGNQSIATVEGDDAEDFEPYLDHYITEGHTPAAATRLAKAEWAAEAAVEAGVIKEDTKKSGERVNRILFPEDKTDTWELRFRGHMAAVERAADFIGSHETKINYLRRKSTCEKVASANAKWLEQVERVCNLHPAFVKE